MHLTMSSEYEAFRHGFMVTEVTTQQTGLFYIDKLTNFITEHDDIIFVIRRDYAFRNFLLGPGCSEKRFAVKLRQRPYQIRKVNRSALRHMFGE